MLNVLAPACLALLSLTGPRQEAPDPGSGGLFAPASADMVIPSGEGGESWTLLDVLRDYSQVTGQHLRMNDATRDWLAGQKAGLTRSAAVPRAEVQSFVENLLVGYDCYLCVERTAAPRLLSLFWTGGSRNPQQVRELALYATEGELEGLRAHPAVIVSTAVDAPHVDGRQLVNSMRVMLTDSNRQMMVPAGTTSTLFLAGPAPWVWQMVQLVRAADESSRREAEEAIATIVRLPLQHANAEEVAGVVEELLRASTRPGLQPNQGGVGRPYSDRNRVDTRVLADGRTNSLLASVMPADLDRLRELVAMVDVAAQ